LTDIGVNWTILGHSERRQYYSETDDIIAEKAKNAITNNVSVIYCIGETLDQREKNQTFEVLKTQLTAASSMNLKNKLNYRRGSSKGPMEARRCCL
jgi:triosephosphate isomerase